MSRSRITTWTKKSNLMDYFNYAESVGLICYVSSSMGAVLRDAYHGQHLSSSWRMLDIHLYLSLYLNVCVRQGGQ